MVTLKLSHDIVKGLQTEIPNSMINKNIQSSSEEGKAML